MCWADTCCYYFKIDFGCILIGVTSFLFSSSFLFVSTLLFADPEILTLRFSYGTLRVVYGVVMVLCACNLASAVMLIVGVYKCKPGLVLSYFGLGIFTTILLQLGGLLVLLAQHWAIAGAIFGLSLIYIHFLVVVHTLYDSLLQKDDDDSYDRLQDSVVEDWVEA